MVAWFPRDSELLKVFLNRVKVYRARLSSDYKIWELMSNWGNWKTSKNKWIVSVSYILRKCYNGIASCMNDTWYKLWTRFKVRGFDGYAVSNAVGRRKKEMENWCVMDLNIIGLLTINREKWWLKVCTLKAPSDLVFLASPTSPTCVCHLYICDQRNSCLFKTLKLPVIGTVFSCVIRYSIS